MSEGLTLAKLMGAKTLMESNDVPEEDRVLMLPFHPYLENAYRPGLNRRRRSYWVRQFWKSRKRRSMMKRLGVRDPFYPNGFSLIRNPNNET